MRLFDLHCDTLSEIYRKKEGLRRNTCHVDIDRALSTFESYTQVLAVWSEHNLSEDECYERCIRILDLADREAAGQDGFTPIYAVEGAKLLNGDIARLSVLKNRGVKILTLVWKGMSCIGGAYDNGEDLTDFGINTVRYCFENGITPDLSHSNDLICDRVLELSKQYKRPVMASHSCSRAVFDHPRNVNDLTAREIAECGGVIGVNFVSGHLGGKGTDVILSHIDHLRNICGSNAVCIGGDLDGMGDEDLPDEIKNVSSVEVLYDAISKKYHSEAITDAVFYSNAQNFAKDYLF